MLHPTILSPAMGKIVWQTGSWTLVWKLVWEKENSEFKPVKFYLKNWPCVASCLCGGVGECIHLWCCAFRVLIKWVFLLRENFFILMPLKFLSFNSSPTISYSKQALWIDLLMFLILTFFLMPLFLLYFLIVHNFQIFAKKFSIINLIAFFQHHYNFQKYTIVTKKQKL